MSRAETLRLQKTFPKGTRVEFTDAQWATRLGDVVGHAGGQVIIRSPPHKRSTTSGVTKTLWQKLVKRHRVDGDKIKVVA